MTASDRYRSNRGLIPFMGKVRWARALMVFGCFGLFLDSQSLDSIAAILAWDPSSDSSVAGYKVFWGEVNKAATVRDVGLSTQAEFTNLTPGASYFFYLKSYSATGVESDPTPTVSYTEPQTDPEPPPPSSWAHRDIGAVAKAGSATWNTTTKCTVTASGKDIWSTADEFHFVYKQLQGDAVMIAKVASQAGGDQWAKAGLMIRESLAANSRHCLMEMTRLNGSIFDFRTATGGTTSKVQANDGMKAPCWVKLTRAGSTISGFVSSDGVNWRRVGSKSISLPSTCYWGLAVTSHLDGTLSTAVFEQVSVTGQAFAASSVVKTRTATGTASIAPELEVGTVANSGQPLLSLTFRGELDSNSVYRIQESADLSSWKDVGTLTASDPLSTNESLVELSRSIEGNVGTVRLISREPIAGTPGLRVFRVVPE